MLNTHRNVNTACVIKKHCTSFLFAVFDCVRLCCDCCPWMQKTKENKKTNNNNKKNPLWVTILGPQEWQVRSWIVQSSTSRSQKLSCTCLSFPDEEGIQSRGRAASCSCATQHSSRRTNSHTWLNIPWKQNIKDAELGLVSTAESTAKSFF